MVFDRIFLLNLKRRKDRKAFMEYKLKKNNIKVETIEAVDGRSNEELIDIYKKQYKNRDYYYGKINSIGALGLIKTWQDLLSNCLEYERILILEDDIYFHKEFHKLLEERSSLFDIYDVVTLGGNQFRWESKQETQLESNMYYEYAKDKWCCTYGTYAISLNNKAIKVILDNIQSFDKDTMTIDVTINCLVRQMKLSGCILYPNLVIPEMRDSDNMEDRLIEDIALSRKWNLSDYSDINIYNDVLKLRDKNFSILLNQHINIKPLGKKLTQTIYQGTQLPIVVIIPSYNNKDWYQNNLLSVFTQNYYNWRIIYVDDSSIDNTQELVKQFIEKWKMWERVTYIRNETRKYQAYSRYCAYKQCFPYEICVFLDGDDWLAHNNVFQILNLQYQQFNLLSSYGQFGYYEDKEIKMISGRYNFPEYVIKNNSYRQYQWISQHLRTCMAKIIQDIPEKYLQDSEGKWLTRCSDMAEMFWILEGSNGKHKNIGSMLYIYNKDNSTRYPNSYYNEDKTTRNQLIEYIRKLPIKTENSTELVRNIPYEISLIKPCYEIELSQEAIFVVPINEFNTFKVIIKMTHAHDYSIKLLDESLFNIVKIEKLNNSYIVEVKNKVLFTELKILSFRLEVQCNTCKLKECTTNKDFYVYTYKKIIEEEIFCKASIPFIAKDHGQEIFINNCNSRWRIKDNHILRRNCYRIISNKRYSNLNITFGNIELNIIVLIKNRTC